MYILDHAHLDRPGVCQDFASKFVELFLEHFEAQTVLKHLTSRSASASPIKSPKKSTKNRAPGLSHHRSHTIDGMDMITVNRSGTGDLFMHDLDIRGNPRNHGNHSKHSKSLLRRLSFRGFQGFRNTMHKPFRQLFKQHSDESDLSTSHFERRNHKTDKSKLTKIYVECRKESVVHLLSGEDCNGHTQWEKCRLVLLKTTGGHMLEFYTPPKVGLLS